MQVSDYTDSIQELINLIDNLDKYDVYPDINDHDDLGRYYVEELGAMSVPDNLKNYIDYEAFGRDIALDEAGQFTNYGYVRDTQDSFTEYYDGNIENIPEEYRLLTHTGTINEEERENMDYESFKEELAEDLKQNLYERGVEDVEMSFHNIEKTNQSYESLTIVQGGGNIGINFNIEAAFSEYQHTGDYAGVLAESTHAIMQGLENVPCESFSSHVKSLSLWKFIIICRKNSF